MLQLILIEWLTFHIFFRVSFDLLFLTLNLVIIFVRFIIELLKLFLSITFFLMGFHYLRFDQDVQLDITLELIYLYIFSEK